MNNIRSFLVSPLPIIRNTVLFSSFYGQYNDNPKYVSECLYKTCSKIRIVWVKSSKSNEQFPSYCSIVEYGSRDYYMYRDRAQVIVDNFVGLSSMAINGNKLTDRIKAAILYKKTYKQLLISTWHGTPIKKIGLDVPSCKENNYCSKSEYVIAGCDLTRRALASGFNNSIPVRMYGTPRNDVFFHSNDLTMLKQRLKLPQDRRIVLFAPTFRNSINMSGLTQLEEIDIPKLLSSFHDKFGDEWCFVFRVHQSVAKKIDFDLLKLRYADSAVYGNEGDDMAEYLLCADALITDYSGSMVDYALTGKPCFLYSPDRNEYEHEERGFYIDYDSLPFPISHDMSSLIESIDKMDIDEYGKRVKQFLLDIRNIEDGNASERVVRDILLFISSKSL